MTENERIKQVRKSLNLTLAVFGQSIGITSAAMSKVENGKRSVTEQVRKAVCREFGVSETWMLTGDGEMFENDVAHELDAAVKRYHLTQKDRVLIEKFMELPPDIRNGILEYIERVSDSLRQMDDHEQEEKQIQQEVKEFERQLRKEKERAERSSALQNTDTDTKMA